MNTHDTAVEQELRELFAEVPPPPAPAAWGPAPAPADRRSRYARRLALVAAAALIVSGTVVVVQLRRTADVAIAVSALPAAATLNCRLPISALSADRTTGFVVFDHGRATFQRAAAPGATYMAALGRWVDVLPQMVAPDGRSYVDQDFANGQVTVRIVDASGARTVLRTSASTSVFGYVRQGIVLLDMGSAGPADGILHLELLDPATGVVEPFPFPSPDVGAPSQSTGGTEAGLRPEDDAIWMTAYFPSSDSTVVRRYDLATGVTTGWFDGHTDGRGHVEVVATDGHGHPIVQLATSDLFHTNPARRAGIGQRTLLLTAPHHETVLNEGRVGDPGVAGNLGPLSVNDGDRVWLAADDGTIWMYLPGSGLQRMAKVVRTSDQGPPGVVVSGPCR
jgi:hypothetical protein